MFELLAIALALALPYLAILVVLTFLTPSWRWVAGFILASGSVLGGLWIWHWIIGKDVGGVGYFAGLLMGGVLTLAYAVAVVSYLAFRFCYHIRE
jgi:hypothetical protein